MDLGNLSDYAGPNEFDGTPDRLTGVRLVAHLRDKLVLGRRLGQDTGFVNGMGQWFLTVYVLAQIHRGHGGNGMDVIGGAYGYGINVLLLVQHLTKVRVDLGTGKGLYAFRSPYRVHVTKGDDIRSGLGGAGNVGRALSPDPYPGHVYALICSPDSGRNELKGKYAR
jgi:hypothetical protein